jgi:predicted DCC family thiol-disulfide oxidoreductase YuxK
MSQEVTASELELSSQLGGRPLMLYDGACGVCNHAVRAVTQRDHADRFRFAAQQSPLAQMILTRHGINPQAMLRNNSVYLVLDAGSDHEQLLTESNVWVKILFVLGGRSRALGYLLRAIPPLIRNAAYRLIAANRYRLSRRFNICPLPTEAERRKFLA